MQRKLPKLCGNRPIDASSQIIHGINTQGPAVSRKELVAAICHPPCTCADCEQGFYTANEQMQPGWFYRRSLSDDDAKQIAASYINSMQQDRKYLAERLTLCGDISLLLEVIPNLCEKRWIIPRLGFTPEGKQIPPINSDGEMEARSPETRHHLLLQWLSLEVLKTNPAVLFALLHNRTVYSPQDWASFDARQLDTSFLSGNFDIDFSAKCVVMHGLRHGEVVDWKACLAHRADILGFPKARLVLEAQAYLMSSLRKVVDGILQGVDMNASPAAEKWKSMVLMGFRHTDVVELWSPYTNQAFSSPPSFSTSTLISLAQTRLEATVDHLWLLQTEPAYMKRFIVNMCHGGLYESTKDMGASWLVVRGIIEAIESCWGWGWLKNECEHVKSIHNRFRDNIAQGENLPTKYNKALGALELLVVNEVNRRAELLGHRTSQRPGFSHNYTTTRRSQDQGPDILDIKRKGGLCSDEKYLFENDLLDYCVSNLQARPDRQANPDTTEKRVPLDHALVFSLIENHLAKSNFKEKSRIDEVLSSDLSDLAACHEMLVAIRLHRPQNHARTWDEVKQSENRKAWKAFDLKRHFTNEECSKLGKALFKDFYEVQLPSSRKDMAWLDHTKSIRKALEAFWQGIRKDCTTVWKMNGFTEDEVADELEYISATETQEHLDTIQAEEQQLQAQIERNQSNQSKQKNHSPATTPPQTTWGPETSPSTLTPQTTKSKEKTRPITQQTNHHQTAATPNISPPLPLAPPPPPPSKLPIKKSVSEILSHMYPSSAEDSSCKNIEWDLFVHAMSDMGFVARNKGGSAVCFEMRDGVGVGEGKGKGNGEGNGKIIFHKPHPVAKIDALMLRCMGRRMTRRFGWGRGVFGGW
ncbi:hypothetical protein OCU04_008085 [Sclerotinia nivalis]|uniref:Uncharacterized protein n=1 Tax=Sclerotinia nivalis TaxID=352851 RepID=A0A9X0AIA0_9HELO|nr:hypothetical protein OCU04_008085 [Sclerotinia nivalis]